MSSSESAGVSAVTVSDGSIHSFDGEVLSKLIAAACASLDSDRAKAKEYIQRAAHILRVSREARRTTATAFSCVRGGLASWQQKRVVAYVEANIGSNIRTLDLARFVRLSKGHFFRAFRKSFGEPPMAYVAKRRVLRGQERMRNSQASLSQIALACGMCDQAHFTRVFHRTVGVSPGRWRRQFASGLTGPERVAPKSRTVLASLPNVAKA
jgi:AraC family transcriptional regulator